SRGMEMIAMMAALVRERGSGPSLRTVPSGALSPRSSGGHGRRSGTGIYQASGHRVYPEIQSLQAAGAQQDEVAGFTEYDLIAGALAGDVYLDDAGPPFQDGTVRLPEAPLATPLDAKGVQDVCRDPRQLRTGVHQDGLE